MWSYSCVFSRRYSTRMHREARKTTSAMPPGPLASRVFRPGSDNQAAGRLAVEVAGVRILNIALGLITTVVISRALQPDGRGTYVVAILTVTALATLAGGLGTAVGNSFAVSGPEQQVEVVSRSLVL